MKIRKTGETITYLPSLSGVAYGEAFRVHPSAEVTDLMRHQFGDASLCMYSKLFVRLQTRQKYVSIDKNDRFHSSRWKKQDCNQCKCLDLETGEIYLMPPYTKVIKATAEVHYTEETAC